MEKSNRGFASMTLERRKEVAALGGRSCPRHKRAFAVNRDLAAAAGRKSKRGKVIKKETVDA